MDTRNVDVAVVSAARYEPWGKKRSVDRDDNKYIYKDLYSAQHILHSIGALVLTGFDEAYRRSGCRSQFTQPTRLSTANSELEN